MWRKRNNEYDEINETYPKRKYPSSMTNQYEEYQKKGAKGKQKNQEKRSTMKTTKPLQRTNNNIISWTEQRFAEYLFYGD